MNGFSILSAIVLLPLLGAALIALIRDDSAEAARRAKITALLTTIATFVLSIGVWINFDPAAPGYQFVEKFAWQAGSEISYHLGLDGISLFFLLLNCLLMPICILVSWQSVNKRIKAYLISFLVLESLVNGVFCALDLLLFYLFFEAMLIPMYLIIGIWGGEKRVYAAMKFFLYTLLGSVLFLVAVLYLYIAYGTTDITVLPERAIGTALLTQQWLWIALFASFAVKVPMWPFHTWLPDAHVQAPTAGSVILAGILLKIGGYGFLRLSLPILPEASVYFAPYVYALSVIAVIYTSLVALMQQDMKKLIAYSSVAHMGFVTLGIFAFNPQGIEGSIFQMLSHGLVSGALFMCVGVLYDRMHTKEIAKYGGVTNVMPRFAAIFMLLTMASVGLPGTSGFVGEFLTMLGAYKVQTLAAALTATGVVLGAAYMLWLYKRVMFGEVLSAEVAALRDIGRRETLAFVPLILLIIALGIYPKPVFDITGPAVQKLLQQVRTATVAGQLEFAQRQSTP